MKACLDKYGLWPTVLAFVLCVFSLALLAMVWKLPDILQALK